MKALDAGREALSPAARRVAEAAVDVIAARGYEGLSVRSVAARAGLTGGAVQHHFATRQALLAAAFRCTADRIADRVGRLDGSGSTRTWLLQLGEQTLPVDDERRREGVVWIVLSAAAATDASLAALHAEAVAMLTDTLLELRGPGPSAPDGRLAAQLLVAVLDGLTLECLTGARSTADARRVLEVTIDRLLAG